MLYSLISSFADAPSVTVKLSECDEGLKITTTSKETVFDGQSAAWFGYLELPEGCTTLGEESIYEYDSSSFYWCVEKQDNKYFIEADYGVDNFEFILPLNGIVSGKVKLELTDVRVNGQRNITCSEESVLSLNLGTSDNNSSDNSANAGKISLGSANGKPDDTVDVPLTITSDANFVAAALVIDFDKQVFSFDPRSTDCVLNIPDGMSINPDDGSDFVLCDENYENTLNAGTYTLTLRFKILSNAKDGAYPIKISALEDWGPTGLIDENWEDVETVLENGSITVSSTSAVDDKSYNIILSADNTEINNGATVNVNLNVDNQSENSFNQFSGILSYDSEYVEYKGDTSTVDENQFAITNDEANHQLTIARVGDEPVTISKDSPELSLKFKAIKPGEATFTLQDQHLNVDLKDNAGSDAQDVAGSSLTIKILEAHKVTFDKGAVDATGTMSDPDPVRQGSEIELPSCDFTREGYTFSKWSDGSQEYSVGDKYTVSADVTFKALWTREEVPTPTGGVVSDHFMSGFDLIGATVNPKGSVPAYNNASMISVKGGKYDDTTYYYVIEKGTFTEENLGIASDSATITIEADDYDINESGRIDINDAQFVYNIYNNDIKPSEHPEKRRLLADANRDQEVNVQDCATIITAIFAKN